MVAQNIAFGIVAAVMVWGALRVVTVKGREKMTLAEFSS